MRTRHVCKAQRSVFDDRWPKTVECGASREVIDGSFHAVQDGCHEPCRFSMGKQGEGDPPFESFDYYRGLQAGLINEPEKGTQ